MAIVGAYNFNALLSDGKVPDMSGYSRNLTLDSGVALTGGVTGRALSCTAGGASAAHAGGDYITNGGSYSCFARVRSLDTAASERVLARSTDQITKEFLLSDASGFLAARINGTLRSSGVSVLDGSWHAVGMSFDDLGDGNVRFWVDGTLVATVAHGVFGHTAGTAGTFSVGRGSTATDRRAQAVMEDVRWFNDPVYPSEAGYFTGPVTNLLVAAYDLDQSGSTATDLTLASNDLTLTANGSWVTGVNGGALRPIATGSAAAAGTSLDLGGGDFDRLSVTGRVRVTATGSAVPFLSLEDASGNPRLQVFRGGALALLMQGHSFDTATYAHADGRYWFLADGVLSTSDWHFFYVNFNPTGIAMAVWDAAGTLLDSTSSGAFGAPTNAPIITDVSTLRLGGAAASGGVAELDDVRIHRNYLNNYAASLLRTEPVTQEPAGVLSNAYLGDLAVAGYYLGADPVDAIYLGADQIYGA